MPETIEQKKWTWYGEAVSEKANGVAVLWAWERLPRLVKLGLGRAERDVLMALVSHTHRLTEGTEVFPTQGTLIRLSGWSSASINRALANLEQAEIIQRKGRFSASTLHTILPEGGGHEWKSVTLTLIDTDSHPDRTYLSQREDVTLTLIDTDSHPDRTYLSQREDVTLTLIDTDSHPERLTLVLDPCSEPVQGNPCNQPVKAAGLAIATLDPQETGQESKPEKPVKRKAAISKPATLKPVDPATELATWYYSLIGEPAREEKAARLEWPGTFRPLINRYGLETCQAAMTWATLSEFWAEKLRRKSGDSAEYALDKFPTWSDQRANESEHAARKKKPTNQAQSSLTSPPEQLGLPGLEIF